MSKHRVSPWMRALEIILLVVAFLMAVFLIASSTQQYWKKTEVALTMTPRGKIAPSDSLHFDFNQTMKTADIGGTLEIFPAADVETAWTRNSSHLEIRPLANFSPGKSYMLSFEVPRGIFHQKRERLKFEFSIENWPEVSLVVPGKDEASIKVDSEIRILFEAPVENFNVNFEISPTAEFGWQADEMKKEFRVIPKEKFAYDTAYWMKITAQALSNNNEAEKKEIFYGKFQTEKRPIPIAVRSNSAVIPEDQVVDLAARISDGKYIDINLAKQHLSIFESGRRLGTYRISTGKRGMATPSGNFKILGKRGRAWSNKYKLYMPYFMQFTGVGHGIHELPEWPGGYKEGAAHLGTPVSHGCVRLGIGPAETVYNFASLGTPVVIHY